MAFQTTWYMSEIPCCRECQKQPRCSNSPYLLDNRRTWQM